MTKWARVVDGLVLECFGEAKPELHATLDAQLTEVANDVEAGYVWSPPSSSFIPRPPNIARERAAAIAVIDGFAETVRLRFITGGSGQALVYEVKRSEVAGWMATKAAGGTPSLQDYPMAAAEAARRAISGDDVIGEWNAMVTGWLQAASAIEAVRLGGKEAVAIAADVAGVHTARDTALAELDAIGPTT